MIIPYYLLPVRPSLLQELKHIVIIDKMTTNNPFVFKYKYFIGKICFICFAQSTAKIHNSPEILLTFNYFKGQTRQ